MLIGSDYYLDLVLSQRVEIQPGLYLLALKVGWILTGRVGDVEKDKPETGLLIISNTSDSLGLQSGNLDSSVSIICDIKSLCNLDSIGIQDQFETSADKEAMKSFNDTLQFSNGRYFVQWPWKYDNPSNLPRNRELAIGRLRSCVSRMRRKSGLIDQYNSIIQYQIS